jgi:hypothetical protein
MRRIARKLAVLAASAAVAGLSTSAAAQSSAPTAAEASARAAITARAPHAKGSDLVAVGVEQAFGDTFVRFAQRHHGLPVVGRGAAVRLDASGHPVHSTVRIVTGPASIVPTVTASSAARTAARFTRAGVSAKDAHLVIFDVRGQGRLAWMMEPDVPPGVPSAPQIVVDAQTGVVLRAIDRVVFLNQAGVYDSSPATKDPRIVMRPLSIVPETSSPQTLGGRGADVLAAYTCIDRKTTRSLPWDGNLVAIHTCELEQRVQADGFGDFRAQPFDTIDDARSKDDDYAELSVYYHASRAYDYFRRLRGDMSARVVTSATLPLIANLQLAHGLTSGDMRSAADRNLPLEPFQNAFFSPTHQGVGELVGIASGGGLYFGQGPRRDFGYDPDVVYHEFTHAVVDRTLRLGKWRLDAQGASSSPGALNEAIADYFAAVLSGDPHIGEYAAGDYSSSLPYLRNVENDETCLSRLTGEVHFDSTAFSGALWTTRNLIDPSYQGLLDAAIYKAMLSDPDDSDLGFEEMTELVATALARDLPMGERLLRTEMTRRGFSPRCERVVQLLDGRVRAPRGHVSPGTFVAPGRGSIGANPDGTAIDVVPGIMQVKMDLPKGGARGVQINFTKDPRWGTTEGLPQPFTPVVLVRFDRPISWARKGTLTHDADLVVDTTKRGPWTYEFGASFDVPKGVESIYIQIDGTYEGIGFTLVAPSSGKPPGAGTDEPDDSRSLSARGGCTIATAASSGDAAGLAATFAIVLLGLGRARRRR